MTHIHITKYSHKIKHYQVINICLFSYSLSRYGGICSDTALQCFCAMSISPAFSRDIHKYFRIQIIHYIALNKAFDNQNLAGQPNTNNTNYNTLAENHYTCLSSLGIDIYTNEIQWKIPKLICFACHLTRLSQKIPTEIKSIKRQCTHFQDKTIVKTNDHTRIIWKFYNNTWWQTRKSLLRGTSTPI